MSSSLSTSYTLYANGRRPAIPPCLESPHPTLLATASSIFQSIKPSSTSIESNFLPKHIPKHLPTRLPKHLPKHLRPKHIPKHLSSRLPSHLRPKHLRLRHIHRGKSLGNMAISQSPPASTPAGPSRRRPRGTPRGKRRGRVGTGRESHVNNGGVGMPLHRGGREEAYFGMENMMSSWQT